MLPYERISNSIPVELASLLWLKFTRLYTIQSTMLSPTSRLTMFDESNNELERWTSCKKKLHEGGLLHLVHGSYPYCSTHPPWLVFRRTGLVRHVHWSLLQQVCGAAQPLHYPGLHGRDVQGLEESSQAPQLSLHALHSSPHDVPREDHELLSNMVINARRHTENKDPTVLFTPMACLSSSMTKIREWLPREHNNVSTSRHVWTLESSSTLSPAHLHQDQLVVGGGEE